MEIQRETSEQGVLTLTLDDGNKNTLTPEAFEGMIAALDEETEARAIVLTGREGVFSAGLDLAWLQSHGVEGLHVILPALGRCAMRWWTEPRPTVCAATGHAIAAGTILAMACDHAVAAAGHWWGLTETRIDFQLPEFAITLARHNLPAHRLEDLLLPGERLDAADAAEAGFADEVVIPDRVLARAQERAATLAELPPRAYAGNKRRLRGADADAALAGLAADIERLAGGARA